MIWRTRSQDAELAANIAECAIEPSDTVEHIARLMFDAVDVMKNILVASSTSRDERQQHIQFATELQRAYVRRATMLGIL